jgi:tetratricopeptide (TPR) repeat protein
MTWKKYLIAAIIFVIILATPLVMMSNPMMDVWQTKVDGNPPENKWLQMAIANVCYKTWRPERAADAYLKYMQYYPDDPQYPYAWIRYAQSLEECHQNRLAEENYQLFLDTYLERSEFNEYLDEAHRGLKRVRYQKRK